ncbi:hypothetical protein OSB04_006619 [Centaurea solstitialis]|uniref:ATP-dependent DNA helicase n=1 Tax=Centaurea solstitialis TaxID=347529 RepID=A0AA38TK19_9ASTR|nr:hypothetical protein OSB04_006619 [Centaurea solstitialis]
MEGEPRQCHFRYPRQFNDHMTHPEDSYPVYRRRDNEIEVHVRGKNLDNRCMVPYNPKLLMMFNCHINVEACCSVIFAKYIFKYIYKGHHRQVVTIDPDVGGGFIIEIKRFRDARYVSPLEAIWRIFGFRLSQIKPSVIPLQIHLLNQQLVRFSENDVMEDVVDRERQKRTMLTVDRTAINNLYKDFPNQYTWNNSSRQWNPRIKGTMKGQLVFVISAKGERFYLRLLLSLITGPTSFEDLCTVNGMLHPTFRKAALERGLIEDDNSRSQCLVEASVFQFPNALRRLFATILIYCELGDVCKFWNDHYDSLSKDYKRQYDNLQRVQDMVLADIVVFLQSMGKDLNDFDLPTVDTNSNLQDVGSREVQEEYSIIVEDKHLQVRESLNLDQKSAFDDIMRHVNDDCPGIFFVDDPSGTGKTFLYKALLAEVCSRGLIALAIDSSGIAANNMPGSRTAHSRFKIPFNLDNNSFCYIKQQSGTAQLICDARLIIWDEASMAKRQATSIWWKDNGDFRQVLPVVRCGTRAHIVDSSLRMSPLWSAIKKI